jgi:lysophospholipase L1-like esterase
LTGKRYLGQGGNTRNGFAYQVPSVAAARGYRLELVNFGCAGATTSSLIEAKGCAPQALGPGGRAYPNRTQLAAASRFLRRNRKRTALVTVSIGGNNVTACVSSPDPVACGAAAVVEIREDVTRIARRLRRAAGPTCESSAPPISRRAPRGVGERGRRLAQFRRAVGRRLPQPDQPRAKEAYASARGRFVDVTAASGAYIPFDQAFRDIHARTDGYRLIADLVARQLPRRG